jgi:hypothetical protein
MKAKKEGATNHHGWSLLKKAFAIIQRPRSFAGNPTNKRSRISVAMPTRCGRVSQLTFIIFSFQKER